MSSSNPSKPWVIVSVIAVAVAAWLYRPDVRWYMSRLDSDRPETRVVALRYLASKGSAASAARERILAKLRDSDPAVQRAAVDTIQRLGWGQQIVPSLIHDFEQHDSPFLRIRACEVVSCLGSDAREAVAALTELLADDRSDDMRLGFVSPVLKRNTVRQAALQALGAIGRDAGPAAPRIVALLPKTDFSIQTAFGIPSFLPSDSDPRLACKTLASVGPGAVAVVSDLAALLNRQPDTNAAFPNLREIVTTENASAIGRQRGAYGEYRSQLAMVLGRIGSRDAIAPLKTALEDSDPRVKSQAALAIWRIDRSSAGEVKPVLAALAASGNELIAREAVAALTEINEYRVAGNSQPAGASQK
jgi:HEAT repeat protein